MDIHLGEHQRQEDADGKERQHLGKEEHAGHHRIAPLLRSEQREPRSGSGLFLSAIRQSILVAEIGMDVGESFLRAPLGDVPQGGFGRAEADEEGDQAGYNGSAEHETPAVVAKGGDKTVHEKADNIRNAIADGPEDQQPPQDARAFFGRSPFAEQWDAHRIVRADEHTQDKAHYGDEQRIGKEELQHGNDGRQQHE